MILFGQGLRLNVIICAEYTKKKLFFTRLKSAGITLDKLVFIFCQEGYNEKGAKLHYLGPVLSNLSQLSEARQQVIAIKVMMCQRI